MGKDERKIEAFELYKQGLSLVDIARKLDVPEGTIRTWKRRGKWDETKQPETKRCEPETVKRNKGGQPGNKNAVGEGAPKGNTNAVKHGLFSKYFTADTRDIYEQLLNGSPLDMLWHNIIFLQAEILRSQQIMFVKDSSDKTIEKVGFSDGSKMQSEQWEVQQAWDKQGNYLKALSRAQAELRKYNSIMPLILIQLLFLRMRSAEHRIYWLCVCLPGAMQRVKLHRIAGG